MFDKHKDTGKPAAWGLRILGGGALSAEGGDRRQSMRRAVAAFAQWMRVDAEVDFPRAA